jgi:hypothetical protein
LWALLQAAATAATAQWEGANPATYAPGDVGDLEGSAVGDDVAVSLTWLLATFAKNSGKKLASELGEP